MSFDPLETVRIGIVGPSWWVNYWHLPAIQNHPYAEIVGVSGETPREDAEIKEKYGSSARFFGSYEEMMDATSPDGVIVCTPNDLHYPVTMAALKRGIHVNCEKPVSLNAGQAKEMADTARDRKLIVLTNFPYRDNPAVQKFRDLVAEGYVGTPLTISGSYHGGFGLGRNPNWRSLRERSGSGILGDLGSHLIDLIRFVTGDEFVAVQGHTLTTLWNEGAAPDLIRTEDPRAGVRNDDSCMILAEMRSGAQGVLHTSWVAYQGEGIQQQEIEIYGDGGRLHFLCSHRGVTLRGIKKGEPHWEEIEVAGTVTPAQAQGEEEDYFRPGRHSPTNTTYRWIEAIRKNDRSLTPNMEDGWKAQQVIDATLASSAARQWTDVEAVS